MGPAETAAYPKRGLQDSATVAWNLATGLYYKTQPEPPWKLAHVRPGVCYIGLVFKIIPNDPQEPSASGMTMHGASAESTSRYAIRRPCHCLLRQPLRKVRLKRCCVAVSPMTAPALPDESSANNTRPFSLKCRYGQKAGVADTPYCHTLPPALFRNMEERRLSFWPQGILLPNGVCASPM